MLVIKIVGLLGRLPPERYDYRDLAANIAAAAQAGRQPGAPNGQSSQALPRGKDHAANDR